MSQAGDRPEDDEEGKRDVVLISGIDRARNEVHVLKPAQDGIEAAVLRQVEDGVPLTGDLVRLHAFARSLAPIVELIAPRYVAERHGPAAGLNLLQAYLALGDPDGARHVLGQLA